MKFLKYTSALLLSLLIFSCDSDDEDQIIDETSGLKQVTTITNDTHSIELYTVSGALTQGHNEITLRIKDQTSTNYIENASINWTPVMHMTSMMHSCPKSAITKVADTKTLYSGYIIFQMAENLNEGWDLTLNYTIAGKDYTAKNDISVPSSEKRSVAVFQDDNDVRYVIALISPSTPEVTTNDMAVSIHKMESMMSFPVVENYIVKNDPRMPSMDNHSSPNNTDLTFNSTSNFYEGKLSLTMTGYWKLNLMVYNQDNILIKGEAITDINESSSLYLELEF